MPALPGAVTLNTLGGTSFFNEDLQGLNLGSTISFQLDATTNGPSAGAPDAFSFFILSSAATTSLLTTTDPTGGNSLFGLQIDGSPGGLVDSYTSSPSIPVTLVPVSSTPVPEPTTFALLLFGLLGLSVAASRKRLLHDGCGRV